jgi:hypothetical protein
LFAVHGASSEFPLTELAERIGYLPATPTDPGLLQLASAVMPAPVAPATPRSLLLYADGLDYLRVGERPDWRGPGPFGPVGLAAQQVALPQGGVGYYEPAGTKIGRRLAIHSPDTDLYLETNLTRSRLLSIASSIPLRGRPLPRAWRVESAASMTVTRTDPDQAAELAGISPLPAGLPNGYVVASASVARAVDSVVSVTFYLRQRDSDAAGGPVTFHVERGVGLPPPSGFDQVRVDIGSMLGRWSRSRSQLEWVDHNAYRSVQGAVDLRVLVAIATRFAGSSAP